MIITKRIQSGYKSILRAKIYFFLRKSLWMYLGAMFLLAYGFPLASFGVLSSGLIYFFIFLAVVLVPIYHFSSKAIAAKDKLHADIEFNDKNIILKHKNKTHVELMGWDWVKELHITRNAVFFIVNYPHRFLISFGRKELSENEVQFLLTKTR